MRIYIRAQEGQMRYIALALVAFVCTTSPALSQKGMLGKEFPTLAGHTLIVKNQGVLVNVGQRSFKSGDTCGTREDGSLKVMSQSKQDVIVLYAIPSYKETVNQNCPNGVIAESTVKELENLALEYRQAEENRFFSTFVPQRDYREQ